MCLLFKNDQQAAADLNLILFECVQRWRRLEREKKNPLKERFILINWSNQHKKFSENRAKIIIFSSRRRRSFFRQRWFFFKHRKELPTFTFLPTLHSIFHVNISISYAPCYSTEDCVRHRLPHESISTAERVFAIKNGLWTVFFSFHDFIVIIDMKHSERSW